MKLIPNTNVRWLYIFVFLNMFCVLYCKRNRKIQKHLKQKSLIANEIENLKKTVEKSCTNPKRKGDKLLHLVRHPRDTRFKERPPKGLEQSIYFSGKEMIKLKAFHSSLPSESFTFSVMINPEGGQHDPVTILEMVDTCNGRKTNNWLRIGIGTNMEISESGQKYFVTLKTERSNTQSSIYTNKKYGIQWTKIDITYNINVLKLYQNGALVAVNNQQLGPVFPEVSKSCKTLIIGGDEETKTYFRGHVTGLQIWNYAKNQSDLRQSLVENEDLNKSFVLYENFVDLKKWRSLFKTLPKIVSKKNKAKTRSISLSSPPCGETVCDDQNVMKAYKQFPGLRDQKEISYTVYNILNDDGSNPQITWNKLRKQHIALIDTFAPYNITFKLDTKQIKNSTIRNAIVLYACDVHNIGNDVCDDECFYSETGNDGGDCDHLFPVVPKCESEKLGNKHCDPECNKYVWDWDDGDCCLSSNKLCIDPESPNRSYFTKDEFKEMIGEDSSSQLNIYLASTLNPHLAGLSTYPWDKHVYTKSGGILVPPESFGESGKLKSLVHEIGHVLGLWHVHHGVSEMNCNNPCLETHASPELGDLCSDTNPTPDNDKCHDPTELKSTCGMDVFKDTPFRNYMSYSDDSCANEFTLEQSARMHCYLDLVYQPWRKSKKPAPVPLPPKIISSTNESVTLSWLPPLGSKQALPKTLCDICSEDSHATQYASTATASHPDSGLSLWRPIQAIGPPDAEKCTASDKAWMMPDSYICNNMDCFIDFGFDFKIIPTRLTVWVTYVGSTDVEADTEVPIKSIELTTDDNKIISLGSFPVSCDTLLTVSLDAQSTVSKVRIYVPNSYTAIDAVELSTDAWSPQCRLCRQQKYKIARDPDFTDGKLIHTTNTEFTDSGLDPNTTYTYTIYASRGSHESVASPPLAFLIGQSFCGNGIIDSEEECDDGNIEDEDGCDINCKVEEFFKCKGQPSNCFIHDGDGICEESEKPYSIKDCGYYTPPDREDQWVTSATANPEYQGIHCPESLLFGIPKSNQKCVSNTVPNQYWRPCNNKGKEADYWIKVFFAKPKVATEIIIHLASDGLDEFARKQTLLVDLLTADNSTNPVSKEHISVSCAQNPVSIPIVHDLSQPFFLTRGVRLRFTSPRLSIAGVRMRSSKYLDPVTISKCEGNELYDPKTGRCAIRSCVSTSCGKLTINHGIPICSGLQEGDFCDVSCNLGYRAEGLANEFICVNGTWQSYGPFFCTSVKCEEPFMPYATVSCPNGFQYGDKCNFNCKSPAKLIGEVSTIQCRADGTWSLPNAFCQIHCKAPSSRPGAKLVTRTCKKGYHSLGQICKFRCEKEYRVEGRAKIKRVFKLECGEDGTWQGNTCVQITCPAPDQIFKGLYKCSDEFNAGSICSMTCPESSIKQSIQCKVDGTWTYHFNVCSSAINASCPLVKDTSKVKFECSGNNIGAECSVHCFLPNAVPTVNGVSNKVRGRLAGIDSNTGNDPVRKITCTALQVWTHDPLTLTCKVGCNKDFVGDTFCQAEYNTKECSYDGGDCCVSTVFDGFVITIPFSCGKACSCIDPNAKENQKDNFRIKSKSKIFKSKYRQLALSRYSYKRSKSLQKGL